MSVAAAIGPPRARRSVGLATLAAAAAGVALGIVLTTGEQDGPEPRAAAAPPRIALTSGVARLPLPDGWEPLRRRSSLPGLEEATAVRGVAADVALDIRAPEHPSLLPAGVPAATAGGLPAPRSLRVGARTAWRYELPGARAGTRIVALALPTTGGVVTIACSSPSDTIERAGRECEGAMAGLQLDGASALTPARETAAAIALPETIAQLNRRRSAERSRLAATRSPARRSAAATRLARGYTAAAQRLRPVAGGDAARLTTTLTALARRHGALASASARRDARAARRAGALIEREEQRLAALLAQLTELRAVR